MRHHVVLLATAVLLAGCRTGLPGERGETSRRSAPIQAPALVAEADRMAARDLWPGFDPRTMPVAIFDGRQTWLFRHPSAPEGFAADPEHPGVRIFPGRHPSVTANTSTSLGGIQTAVLLLDSPRASRAAFAAVLIHESFHVYQHRRHPTRPLGGMPRGTSPPCATSAWPCGRPSSPAVDGHSSSRRSIPRCTRKGSTRSTCSGWRTARSSTLAG